MVRSAKSPACKSLGRCMDQTYTYSRPENRASGAPGFRHGIQVDNWPSRRCRLHMRSFSGGVNFSNPHPARQHRITTPNPCALGSSITDSMLRTPKGRFQCLGVRECAPFRSAPDIREALSYCHPMPRCFGQRSPEMAGPQPSRRSCVPVPYVSYAAVSPSVWNRRSRLAHLSVRFRWISEDAPRRPTAWRYISVITRDRSGLRSGLHNFRPGRGPVRVSLP